MTVAQSTQRQLRLLSLRRNYLMLHSNGWLLLLLLLPATRYHSNQSPYKHNKYQLSQINPRDGTVLQTELDDHCDKLQRSSVGAQSEGDDSPVYHAR